MPRGLRVLNDGTPRWLLPTIGVVVCLILAFGLYAPGFGTAEAAASPRPGNEVMSYEMPNGDVLYGFCDGWGNAVFYAPAEKGNVHSPGVGSPAVHTLKDGCQ